MMASGIDTVYEIDPPLRLVGSPILIVSTSTEAARYCRDHPIVRRPLTRNGALRSLESARTIDEQRKALKLFIFWADGEQLILI
jgi:hypothetical protein